MKTYCLTGPSGPDERISIIDVGDGATPAFCQGSHEGVLVPTSEDGGAASLGDAVFEVIRGDRASKLLGHLLDVGNELGCELARV